MFRGMAAVVGACGVVFGLGAVWAFLLPSPGHPMAQLGFGMEEAADNAARTESPDAVMVNLRLLNATPGSGRAWNRQAWLEGRRGVTPASVHALRRSYAVAPFGPTDSVWRLNYIYERWDALPADLRRMARNEHRLHVRSHGRSGVRPSEITNAAGRLAARMNHRRQPKGGGARRGRDVTYFATQHKR